MCVHNAHLNIGVYTPVEKTYSRTKSANKTHLQNMHKMYKKNNMQNSRIGALRW